MLFFTCIKLVVHELTCLCAFAHIKWRRLDYVILAHIFDLSMRLGASNFVVVSSLLLVPVWLSQSQPAVNYGKQ